MNSIYLVSSPKAEKKLEKADKVSRYLLWLQLFLTVLGGVLAFTVQSGMFKVVAIFSFGVTCHFFGRMCEVLHQRRIDNEIVEELCRQAKALHDRPDRGY